MLPARSRLRNRTQLGKTVRRGTRAGRRCLVVHFLAADPDSGVTPPGPAKVGFAVSKAVGGSVVRHQVTRRLRHVVAAHLSELPDGSSVVVRALPAAAEATSAQLDADFSSAIARVA
ncbi:MAG: ribonuclease P protein component [Candidatus Nanopelagicales bacterium]